MDYQDFLKQKLSIKTQSKFDDNLKLNDKLFDFQKDLVQWSLGMGRSAIFADCGLGKSFIELEWAIQIVRKTNKNVLLITPIAVGEQMLREAGKFGIEDVTRSRDGKINSKITITNYERLHYFNPEDFIGVILDESSILKNFKGAVKNQFNIFVRKIQYRLLATATAAPNDFVELGTSSEALGYLGYMDMLGKFFKNDQNNCANNTRGRFTEATKWRLKGHSHDAFWRWVTSWARAIRRPSDLGYQNKGFDLPQLNEIEHNLGIARTPNEGYLFTLPANGLKEVRDERRHTINERCEKAASIANSTKYFCVVWCNLNDEGDLLEKMIPDAVQVSGRDSDDSKEEKLINFSSGKIRVLVTKPKIGAWGLNWQHCNNVVFFPAYSYEQYYQAIRRCWRFGQLKPVNAHLIYTEGDHGAMENLRRKQHQADEMFTRLVAEMNNSLSINNVSSFEKKVRLPKWA